MLKPILLGISAIGICGILKLYIYYKKHLKDITEINSSALITDKDHKPKIIITHISEESNELNNYVQSCLENLFLNSDDLLDNFLDDLMDDALLLQEDKIPEMLTQGHRDKMFLNY